LSKVIERAWPIPPEQCGGTRRPCLHASRRIGRAPEPSAEFHEAKAIDPTHRHKAPLPKIVAERHVACSTLHFPGCRLEPRAELRRAAAAPETRASPLGRRDDEDRADTSFPRAHDDHSPLVAAAASIPQQRGAESGR